jgi:topoisomerase-4 subunit B
MPPLYRIDIGKNVYYALDDHERDGVLQRIEAEGIRGRVNIQRFKGLGEMNPMQLRETTMNRDTRRLVQLTLDPKDGADATIDMLLAKGRAGDRKDWLMEEGNMAEILE